MLMEVHVYPSLVTFYVSVVSSGKAESVNKVS